MTKIDLCIWYDTGHLFPGKILPRRLKGRAASLRCHSPNYNCPDYHWSLDKPIETLRKELEDDSRT